MDGGGGPQINAAEARLVASKLIERSSDTPYGSTPSATGGIDASMHVVRVHPPGHRIVGTCRTCSGQAAQSDVYPVRSQLGFDRDQPRRSYMQSQTFALELGSQPFRRRRKPTTRAAVGEICLKHHKLGSTPPPLVPSAHKSLAARTGEAPGSPPVIESQRAASSFQFGLREVLRYAVPTENRACARERIIGRSVEAGFDQHASQIQQRDTALARNRDSLGLVHEAKGTRKIPEQKLDVAQVVPAMDLLDFETGTRRNCSRSLKVRTRVCEAALQKGHRASIDQNA
jgi:hypothetical protein